MEEQQEPGQLIIPHTPNEQRQPAAAPVESRPLEVQQVAPVQAAAPVEQPVEPSNPLPAENINVAQPVSDDSAWQFREESSPATPTYTADPEATAELNWTASEFIAHEKGMGWYTLLAGGAIVIAAIVYLITKDKVSTIVVLFAAIMLAVFGARKPRTQSYNLAGNGIRIGQKFYSFQDFKTFSVGQDGAIASIVLTPLKRFMPPLTIYVAPDIAERVVTLLGNYLPFEQHKVDAVDGLLKRMRF